ncbi:MAG TPA: TAXI family TRAP transporter solute-binding subunit [Burkholderiaceae bacterium]|nr:TAXI family TRAP transporter solute-binding subunit [Burkholderiaceae bacterium]
MRRPDLVFLTVLRSRLSTAAPFVLLALGLLGLAYWALDPNPPRRVVLATGLPQGAYAEFGARYAERLARHGIQVELRNTQGAAENLALLGDPGSGVDIAFAQGGAAEARDDEGLLSLGSMFHEPVWLFYRRDSAQRLLKAPRLSALAQLAGWRVNIGAPGSGVPHVAHQLLEANRIEPASIALSRQPLTPAVADLLEGRLDAVVLASAPESLMVQMLLRTPGIELFDFVQADAYTRRFAFLNAVTLPRGVVDLASDMPPADVHMVAPTATLVARASLHPALVQLFVQAAQDVHGQPGWFQRKGDFPNARDGERPLAPEAERFYRNGVPWLQRYLPFWLANLVDRMWIALLSIVAVLLPLSRVVPPLVELRIRSRVFRWYGQLRDIEDAAAREPRTALLERLDAIEARVDTVQVPLSYTDELYALKSHIQLVRRRLQAG